MLCAPEPLHEARLAHLAQRIPELMQHTAIPGFSLALIQDAQLYWSQGFGLRHAASPHPVTPDTVFEAASLSKPLFAYAALKLCEEGILELDRPLIAYLPEPYLRHEPRQYDITLRHVVSHTTGFPNHALDGGDNPQPMKIYFPPGERFSYSCEGYLYLQKVVEHVTGQAPAAFMQAKLLQPLGMHNSSYVWTGEPGTEGAYGHDSQGAPREKRRWPTMNAAVSLHSTPHDYAQFMMAMMHQHPQQTLHLRADLRQQMLTPQIKVNDSRSWHADWPKSQITLHDRLSWGLGWGIQHHKHGSSFWHWGSTGIFQSFAVGFPKAGRGLVMMANSANGPRLWPAILRASIGGEHPAIDWFAD